MYPLPDRYGMDQDLRMPTLAVYRLASLVRSLGHEAVVVDPTGVSDDDLSGMVAGADLVGLSANSFSWAAARTLSLRLGRLCPSIPIALGGIHPGYFDTHCLNMSGARFVVRGEGERSLPVLLDALSGWVPLASVPGLTWNDDGLIRRNPIAGLLTAVELERLPPPAYDLVPAGRFRAIPVETSRGCRYSCAFCSIPYRGGWRPVRPERVAEIVSHALSFSGRFLVPALYFLDDCFTTSGRRSVRALDGIVGLDAWIGLEARADQLTEPVVTAIARHRVWLIQIGVECGYAGGLERVGKKITIGDVESAAALLKQQGLIEQSVFSFIVGLPWETIDECRETISFALYLALRFGARISMSWYEPFPGSAIWRDRLEYGARVGPEAFDGPADWRHDSDLFRMFRPRMTVDDCLRVEELIAGCAAVVPHHLDRFQYRAGQGSVPS